MGLANAIGYSDNNVFICNSSLATADGR
jgi:hypothetical protein